MTPDPAERRRLADKWRRHGPNTITNVSRTEADYYVTLIERDLAIDGPTQDRRCICPADCDCQNPDPADGPAGVSNLCPVHNDRPMRDPDCEADRHRNGAS